MAERFLVAGGTGNWNSTTNWSATDGGASGASFPVAGDNVHCTAASGAASLTVNVASACANIDFTGFTGTFAGASALAVSGSWTWSAGAMTQNYTGTITWGSTVTVSITSNGKQFKGAMNFNGVGGKWQIQDAFSSTAGITLTNGRIDNTVGSFSFQAASMVCAAGTKGWDWGNGQYTWTGSGGTIFSNQQLANYTQTLGGSSRQKFTGGAGLTSIDWSGSLDDVEIAGGTGGWSMAARSPTFRDFILSNPGAGTVTVNTINLRNLDATAFHGTLTQAAAQGLNGTGNFTLSSTMTWNSTTGAVNCADLNFNGYAGTWQGTGTFTVKGNVTLSAAMTVTYSGNFILAATSGTKTITSHGKVFGGAVTTNGVGGTFQLADAFACLGTLGFQNGTWDPNTQTISAQRVSLGAGTKTCLLSTSHWTLTGTGTAWDTTTNSANYTQTPSGSSKLTFTGGVALTTMAPGPTQTFDDIENTNGAGGFTIVFVNNGCRDIIISNPTASNITFSNVSCRNVDFTGCAGAWIQTLGLNISGDLTLVATMTAVGTARVDFNGNAVVQHITTAGQAITFPLRISGTTNTLQMLDQYSSNQFVQMLNAGCGITSKAGVTNTADRFISDGVAGNTCKFKSDTPGTPSTWSISKGDQIGTAVSVTDIHVTGGARWWAGRLGNDNGGNAGWRFTDWNVRGLSRFAA